MKRLIAVVMCVVCMAPAVFAAGPIETSAASALTQQVQDTNRPRMERKNPDMYWTGVGLMGVGGFMLGWGIGTTSETITCGGGAFLFACTQSGGHRGLYIGTGAGILAAGSVLSVLGGKRVAVSPTQGGFTVSHTASF